ncbi:MAG: redox-sensing transcriptional repressor Rex [Armatimonadota bacterium]
MARALESRKGAGGNSKKQGVSEKVINRLRCYLTALDGFDAEGVTSISSWRLAERVGVNAALIRKDLSRFGDFGTPSLGYEVSYLIQRLRDILRLDQRHKVLWIGAASLRFHAGSLSRLGSHFCGITAVLDSDPHEIGHSVCDIKVEPLDRLEQVLAAKDIQTATIAISGAQAYDIAERLAGNGIKSILNLSGEILPLPDTIRVRNLDLVGELLELCYYSAP